MGFGVWYIWNSKCLECYFRPTSEVKFKAPYKNYHQNIIQIIIIIIISVYMLLFIQVTTTNIHYDNFFDCYWPLCSNTVTRWTLYQRDKWAPKIMRFKHDIVNALFNDTFVLFKVKEHSSINCLLVTFCVRTLADEINLDQ